MRLRKKSMKCIPMRNFLKHNIPHKWVGAGKHCLNRILGDHYEISRNRKFHKMKHFYFFIHTCWFTSDNVREQLSAWLKLNELNWLKMIRSIDVIFRNDSKSKKFMSIVNLFKSLRTDRQYEKNSITNTLIYWTFASQYPDLMSWISLLFLEINDR